MLTAQTTYDGDSLADHLHVERHRQLNASRGAAIAGLVILGVAGGIIIAPIAGGAIVIAWLVTR